MRTEKTALKGYIAGMGRLKNTISSTLFIAALLILSGCHALSRGDIGRHVDNELAFESIGFLMTDGANNALLYRNAIVDVSGDDTYIDITIPYFIDQAGTTVLVPQTGSELTLTFETVAKDAQVCHSSAPETPIEPGLNAYRFHDGTSPMTQNFVIRKYNPEDGNWDTRTFTVGVRKEFHPVARLIDNPNFLAPPDMPAAIAVHFEDELGNTIPLGAPQDGLDGSLDEIWLDDGDGINENPAKKDITVDFSSWDTVTVADTGLALARPLAQGDFRLTVPEEIAHFYFVDQNGFQSSLPDNRTFDVTWDPDAVYMATAAAGGNDGNTGLSASDPVLTLGQALTVAAGSSRWEIRAAEGDYDLGSGVTITDNVSIYGGYRTDFSSRYDMENPDTRAAHGSRFYGVPASGIDINTIGGVLTYDPGAGTINDSSILDGVVLAAATEGNGGGNYTAGLRITGDSSPLIRYCTIAGGGGGTMDVFSGVTLALVTGAPEFRWNVIAAGQEASDGESSGVYTSSSPFIGSGNRIRGVRSNTAISYGLRLIESFAELHYNDIASAQAGTDSIGISAYDSDLLYNGNLIASDDAGNDSEGLVFELINDAYVFKNTIICGNGSYSTGVHAVSSGGDYFEILNNAFRIGNGTTESRGIFLEALAPGTIAFVNNLVDSSDADLLGVRSDPNIAGSMTHTIENNAFDDASWPVHMVIDGTTEELFGAQDNHANLSGNITKSFAFDSNGRLSSGLDANLAYGGRDASIYSGEAGTYNAYDWNNDSRSLNFPSCGWSIGPYEFDNVAYPTAVHVTNGGSSNPGSDEYVLGTAQYPFSSIDQANTAVTDRTPTVGTMELRVAQGTHTVPAAVLMTTDMTFSGGWNQNFSSRSADPSLTMLTATNSTLFDITGVSSDFLMDGFTCRSTFAANSILMIIRDFAHPELRNNVFDGGTGTPTMSYLMQISSNSSPDIHDNQFFGSNSGSDDIGIHVTGLSYPNIYRNTITGGTPAGESIGIWSEGNSFPNIYENTITGGSPTGGDSLGLRLIDCGYATVRNNHIVGGTPVSNDSVLMEISGSSTPYVYGNDLDGASIIGSVTGVALLSGAVPARMDYNNIFSGNSTGENATGIFIDGAGTNPTIQNNTIETGNSGPGFASTTIAVRNAASPTIRSNILTGGDGANSVVVDIDSTAAVIVDGNDITMGTADSVSGIAAASGSHTITGNDITGGNAANTYTGIFLSSAGGTGVTGNTITLGDGDSTVGVTVENTAGFTIENTDVTGGTAVTSLYGIRLSNTTNGTVKNCDIDIAGNAALPVSFGLNSISGFGLIVENNSIAGGSGLNAYGINISGGTVISITDNEISGTSVGTATTTMSTGLYLTGTASTSVRRNTIHAGEASGNSCGIDIDNMNTSSVANNLVHGGNVGSGSAAGIRLNDGDNVTSLFNNTVYAGRSSGGQSYGVHLTGAAQPRMANNLIIAGEGGGGCYGVFQESTNRPSIFYYNAIIGTDPAGWAYRDDGGTTYATSNEIVTYLGVVYLAVPMADYDANLTGEHPSAYLRNFTANGGITEFLNDDWRLSGGGQQDAVAGGANLSTYSTPYQVIDDHDGVSRTIPWSIGAYEF